MKKLTVFLLTLVMLLSLTGCEEAISKLLYKSGRDDPDTVQAKEPDIPDAAPPADSAPARDEDPADSAGPAEPDVAAPEPDAAPAPGGDDAAAPGEWVIRASHEDVSLFSAGETFRFSVWDSNGTGPDTCTFTSADPEIAEVDEYGGQVKAVAPGITTVTAHVTFGGEQRDLACIVRCRWEPSLPGEEPASGTEEQPSSPSLSGFYSTLQGRYEGLSGMMLMDTALLDSYYPGLTGIAAVEEALVYESAISVNNMAVGLVKLSGSASTEDILAVQSILQSRITTQAEGGAFYQESCDTWKNGVITSSSNCVGMFVYPDSAHDMAALFTETFSN